MIQLRCDRCERVLEAPDDLAGRKIECPACGDVNVVPSVNAMGDTSAAVRVQPVAKAAPDRASAAGYPPDSGPEQPVMTVHPVMFRAHPFVGLLVLLALLAGLGGLIYYGLVEPRRPLMWGALAGFGAAVLVLIAWKTATLTERLVISNKRTVERHGLLSKSTTEVVHDDIRNVQVAQTFFQRMLRTGTIGLSSAAQSDVEIVMHNVPNPQGVKRVIDLYRPL